MVWFGMELFFVFTVTIFFMENNNKTTDKKQTSFRKNAMPFIILIGVLIAVTIVLNFVLKAIL